MSLGGFVRFLFGIDEMGENSRDYVIKNCKEGIDPRTAITDFGEQDGDHNQTDHDRANGKAAKRDADGIGYPTNEENETFYDSTRYTGIKINVRKDSK